ncbi:ornithine cyclodeaminase family protein [Phenylobacterium sp.]|uniref:ornithine cyclodeaminase family protein n=1 Tax=Phenylobacterium sp. TaxID=1871053 RepID=UPI0025F23979|nr:ornithine cyclodeaminase family protein [Phenylobacterium sp.]MBX3483372.1 ornithine cyclodeaminase family protein [Phenylobacterium sp.]MCW5758983.1 ornithine cyclodeaminase family protein [Phenylobacterium sp.]
MRLIDEAEVRARLTYDVAIPIVRRAMIAFSAGETRQLLRSIIPLAEGRLFGIMPGALGERAVFGAKLISVYPDNFARGRPSHQGVVALFDYESGAPVCVAHAGAITAIRTAAASAVATDALARPDAARLALLGYGEQAETHVRAISRVRKLSAITVWGRSAEGAAKFAAHIGPEAGVPVTVAETAQAAVTEADIVCTLTPSREPILEGAWIRPGTHVNLVGAGVASQLEADAILVAKSRFIADSREGVLAQGGEFLRAKAAGIVGDDHVVGEIGQVLAGTLPGRQSAGQVTVYKSLGHVVQDLAAAEALFAAG